MKAISKANESNLNSEPVAFFEFQTKKGKNFIDGDQMANFEMNREQVRDIVKELSIIHQKFEELC